MAIPAPIILLPTAGTNYATDIALQTLSGTTSADTERILVNGSTQGVSYTAGDMTWSWSDTLVLGQNTKNIVAVEKTTGNLSTATTIVITLIQSDTDITVSAPTGIRIRRYQDQIEVVCTQNPEPQTIGYNFWVSTDSGGTNGQYVKINKQLITDYSFYEDDSKLISRSVDTSGNIRVTTISEEIIRTYFYSGYLTEARFIELVQQDLLLDVPFEESTRFFFVVSAVIYDTVSGQVTESAYSPELEGTIISITTGIQDLPARTQSDIILTISQEMLTDNKGIDTKPGTVFRDEVDPITEEMARYYIIQDFLSRSLSISALQDFDDSNGDGISDPVSDSIKKKSLQIALNLTNSNDVQTLIDEQFDKLASNVDTTRKAASYATGQVIFFTENPPIRDMTVNEGGIVSSIGDLDAGIPSQTYKTLSTKIITYANREDFYNTDTQRYEVYVDVEAVIPGEASNTESYTIKNAISGIDSNFQVENPNPVSFGEDRESNNRLAGRIQLAMFADTGTEGGYAKTSIAVPGVHNVRVEKAGDPLMMRDYDNYRKEHIGGKVDIYIWGKRTAQISDQIAFSFESIAGTQGTQAGEVFSVLSAAAFQFQCRNTRVGPHTPIFEVTKVYNATRGQEYDIAGYQIVGEGNTIDLDESLVRNITIGLASRDIIRVDYKFRSSDTFILQSQPVSEIVSVVGELSGELTTDNYELVKLEDPLEDGGSTSSNDGIRIMYANNLPLTQFQTITDEEHVLVSDIDEPLDYKGVDVETIFVRNDTRTVTYVENVDYRVTTGSETTSTTLRLIDAGSIYNGQKVLVSYGAIENFTVTYTTNGLLQDVQEEVDIMKHACADVVVKAAVENNVDFVFTVIPKANVTNLNLLTSKIRTAIANYMAQMEIGVALTQSEVVNIIQDVNDVDYVIVPFAKMVKADESFITRDDIGKTQFEVYNEGLVTSYITSSEVLTYSTIANGGPDNLFRGVFEDKEALILQEDPLDVSEGYGRAYIQEDGKIIVSTKDGELPDTKSYSVSYYVYGETGARDIEVASVEYLSIGSMTIVYDTPRRMTGQTL